MAVVGAFFAVRPAAAAAEPRPLDADGSIPRWLVLAAIPLPEAAAMAHAEAAQKPVFDREYFKGQATVTPKDNDRVKVGDAELVWQTARAADGVVDLQKLAFEAGRGSDHALFLGVAYVIAEKPVDGVVLSTGSDDGSAWWVNGREVGRVYAGRAAGKDQDKSGPLSLKQGVNVVRFAVINGEGQAAATARFVDKAGKPVPGLKVTLDPPAAATRPAR
ncbi:MAG TPA: hypothetical protein VF796_02670 [Humisphaera sp.]